MIVTFGDYILDADKRELLCRSEAVRIEPKVFDILTHLILNRDRAVSKDELLEKIWNGRIVSDSALSSAVKAARAAIGDNGSEQRLIKTMHGHGFRFVGQLTEDRTPAAVTPSEIEQRIRFCESVDGTRIAYALTGDGPTMVKSANWMSHLQYELESPIWQPWIQALNKRFQLVRYDERGNGLSERAPDDLSFEARVADLEHVVEHAGLTEPFVLFGISAGCAFSVEYAVRHPERVKALVLYGGFSQGWRPRARDKESNIAEALGALIKSGWGRDNPVFRQTFTTLFMPKATDEQASWFNELQHKTVKPTVAAKLWDEAGNIDVMARLSEVTQPTLVLHATHETLIPDRYGQELAGLIPNARYVALDSENHVLLGHEPAFAKLFDEIDRFVATLD